MMMKKINWLITTLMMLYQVVMSQPVDEKIRLKFDFSDIGPVRMSEIISEISYIPLETNPSCLIGYMNIPVFDEDIIIRSYSGEINGTVGTFRFSNQGKFLNRIGNIGQGPGEYQDNCDVKLIGDTVFVVSNFSNDILCYLLSGDFLKKYHLNTNARPKNMVQLKDKSFMISLDTPSDNGILLNTDRKFKIVKGFIQKVPIKTNPLPNGFEKSRDKIFYYHNYMDTIFEISKGYPIPEIVVDYGRYRISHTKKSISATNSSILNKPSISSFNACDGYIKLDSYYPLRESSYTVLYRMADRKQVTWTELINDIDNGTMERWRGFLADNSMIFHLLPSTILKRFEKMTVAEKIDPKNSAFVKMASKIKPESNPVIMICKLK